jgi:hypothetical protein
MKECDALESNSVTAEVALIKNIPRTTSGTSWASSSIVLSGSIKYRVGSMNRGRCSKSWMIRAWARIGASVSKMTFLSTDRALLFSL